MVRETKQSIICKLNKISKNKPTNYNKYQREGFHLTPCLININMLLSITTNHIFFTVKYLQSQKKLKMQSTKKREKHDRRKKQILI